jgi:chorismate mutase/prephenate dehydratase
MRTFEKSRRAIEIFDEKMLELVALRMDEVEVIGAYKRDKGLPVKDSIREKMILNNLMKKGEGLGLSQDFIKNFYSVIINHSCEIQESQQYLNG